MKHSTAKKGIHKLTDHTLLKRLSTKISYQLKSTKNYYKKVKNPSWNTPNLLIVSGGQTTLRTPSKLIQDKIISIIYLQTLQGRNQNKNHHLTD
jgi:hypothetical protein